MRGSTHYCYWKSKTSSSACSGIIINHIHRLIRCAYLRMRSDIFMTKNDVGRTDEKVRPTVRLTRHRHFVGFVNVSVQAPTQGHPFYGYSQKLTHFSRHLRRARGYRGPILVLNPRVYNWGGVGGWGGGPTRKSRFSHVQIVTCNVCSYAFIAWL